MKTLISVSVVLLFSACGSGSGSDIDASTDIDAPQIDADPGPGPLTFQNYPDRISEAYCGYVARCLHPAIGSAGCDGIIGLIYEPAQLDAVAQGIAAGRIDFNQAGAQAIIDYLSTAPCNDSSNNLDLESGFFTGKQGDAALCKFDAECVSGNCNTSQQNCNGMECCEGVCTAPQSKAANGDACQSDNDCQSTNCYQNVCHDGALGKGCDGNGDCNSFNCQNSLCVAKFKLGEECQADGQCEANMRCVGALGNNASKCSNGASGDDCLSSSDCLFQQGSLCHRPDNQAYGKCVTLAGPGDTCDDDVNTDTPPCIQVSVQGQSGLQCDNGTCKAWSAVGESCGVTPGEACSTFDFCTNPNDTGVCFAAFSVDDNMPCGSDIQCQSGICDTNSQFPVCVPFAQCY